MACPECGAFAFREPGGARCQRGHMFLLRSVLPHDHPLSGRDARNRARQRCLDRVFARPGRAPEFVFDLLDRLEKLE